MSTAQRDDSEKWAKYAYEYDSNGLPTKETKNYGEKGKEEFDTEYTIMKRFFHRDSLRNLRR